MPNTTIVDDFSYDGYGVLLQNESVASANPGKVGAQATSLLYTGEHFDTDSQNYYLRARWYDSLSGRFNRMDPYAGSPQDPQSLHKYLYVHCNPINNIDPTGMMEFSFGGLTINMSIRGILQAIPALPAAAYMWAGTHMALITSVSFYAMWTFIVSTLWLV